MSKETALAFIQKTASDPELQRNVAGLGTEDVSGLLAVASKAGYVLTAEDLRSAFAGSGIRELNGDDLQKVAGGLNPQPLPPRELEQFFGFNPGLLRGIIIVGGRAGLRR